MSNDENKTIRVSKDTHESLWEHKQGPDDTFDDALQRVLARAER